MFNHLYHTAKRILSRSPSVNDFPRELRNTPPTTRHLEVSMVTTRRGTETPGQDSAATPQGTARKNGLKREIEALDTPVATKRQKKSPPKKTAKDSIEGSAVAPDTSADDTSDTIVVAVPRRDETPTQADKLPLRRRSSPKVVVTKPSPTSAKEAEDAEEAIAEDAPVPTQETVYHTPNEKIDSTYETPVTRSRPRASPTNRERRTSERTSSVKKSSGRKKQSQTETDEDEDENTPIAVSILDESEQAPIPSQHISNPPSQAKKAHVRFGSEEPAAPQQSISTKIENREAPTPHPEVADSDDSASDSDEAPEVLTTTAAASRAAASHRDAARAQLAQQEKARLKREAREARIAAEQAEKRAREEKKAAKLARKLAKEAASSAAVETSAKSESQAIDLSAPLPTSLLATIPDRRAPTPPPVSAEKSAEQLRKEKLNHHIKFLERTDKGIKDVKKGKLSVAVLGQQNRVLPPKVNRGSRDVREKWLKGRGVAKKGVKGRAAIGGRMERRGLGVGGFLRDD